MNFSRNQLIFLGLAAHVIAAVFSIGAHHCDEIFQVYEFAGLKLGINTAAELPWEFREHMRSGIQPLMVYSITQLLHAVSLFNPFIIATILRLLQSLLAFVVMVQFLKLLEKEIISQKLKLWLWGFGLLFWCLPYFHARFSSENFSITLFISGLVILLNALNNKAGVGKFLAAGILFGLAFECRFQVSFMILGLFLWLLIIRKTPLKFLLAAGSGVLVSLGLGLLADHWLYGTWAVSWWNYLDLNLFEDKASAYGREPFYFYFSQGLLQLIPPFSLLIVFCMLGFWVKFKKHAITWVTLPFIALHFFVAHKELRFLFPVLDFLPFMLVYFIQSVEDKNNAFLNFLRSNMFIRTAVAINILLLIYFSCKPADDTAPPLEKIYALVSGKAPVLLYDERNPYNNQATLNYFRNTSIKMLSLQNDSLQLNNNPNVYYFSEKFGEPALLIRRKQVFIRQYSNFPAWFGYLNFNGWLSRAEAFSIYKVAKPL